MKIATPITAEGTDLPSLSLFNNSRDRQEITIPLSNLSLNGDTGDLDITNTLSYPLTELAVSQLAKKVKLPSSFVLTAPNEVSAWNFNKFLPSSLGTVILTTEQGRIVSITTDQRNTIDSNLLFDDLNKVNNNYPLTDWSLTPTGIKIRVVSKYDSIEPKLNDIVKTGSEIMLRENEDRGFGIRGLLYRLVCLNGAIASENINAKRNFQSLNWSNEQAKVDIAVDSIEETCVLLNKYAETLSSLTTVPIQFSDMEDEERLFLLKKLSKLSLIPSKYISTVSEAIQTEDDSLFGWYNAITRVGRDANVGSVKETFEKAGFRVLSHFETFLNVTEAA